MAVPLSPQLHALLIRPGNGSLVLGAAHHALYRPANALAQRLAGKDLHRALDPAEWGAAAARAGEKVDYHLALPGVHRAETITLEGDHLKAIHAHLGTLAPEEARTIEGSLDSLVADHYNKGETFRGLVDKAHASQNFRATLHDVPVPSATGEVGRTINNVAVGASTLYGAGAITKRLRDALNPQEKQSSMSKLDTAIGKIQNAAATLEHLPVREAAYAKAANMADTGLIAEDQIEKFAGIFERHPNDADDIIIGMQGGNEDGMKLASFGEVVKNEADSDTARRGGFEAMCLDNAKSQLPYR